MNALDAIAPGPGLLSPPRPDGIGLAARVASAHVRRAMADSPGQQVIFQIVVSEKALTCAIACALDRDLPGAAIAVHEDMATDLLPSRMISHRSLADYQNAPRAAGAGVVAYAPSRGELDVVGLTGGQIHPISEQVLMAEPELWLDSTQELAGLNPRERQNVANALRGIAAADVATGLGMFGEFIERLDRAHASMPIEQAMDRALPALRIPRDAGRFKKLGAGGKLPSIETWANRFRELQALADDALGLRREGAPLSRALLGERLRDLAAEQDITEEEQEVLAALVADRRIEPGQWRPAQAATCELRWAAVERLVKPSKRRAQQPLGDATLALFREKMPDELGPEDKAVLAAMAPDADGADDEERGFFFRHRANIADGSKPLLKRWEQHVFRKTEQHSDLALGLFLAIADLVEGADVPPCPLVYVRLQGAERSKFWETRNLELCRFMRDRYRGLPEVFRRAGVELDWGMCWTGGWDKCAGPARGSKLAREFKFDIVLLDAEGAPVGDGRRAWLADAARAARGTAQLVWTMPADTLASSYSESMEEVANLGSARALLASGQFSRAQDQDRSTDGRLSLERRASFGDAHGRPDGILIDPNDGRSRAGSMFEQGLAGLRGGVLPEADARAIEAAYEAFAASYSDAVRAMVRRDGAGLDDPALLRQSVAYGELLALLRRCARKDDCRRMLWQPMLSVGLAFSDDRPPVAICTPWHPFKLAAAAAKARQLADALARVLGGGAADVRTFSRTVARTVGGGWHPAVALSPATPKPHLLSETDHYADFGLLEAPTLDQGAADAFDGYSEPAARELLAVADEYLEIQPHERANFSVVLYNADNRGLPSFLASALAAKVEQEKDLRCDLVLTHSDQRRLRQIYAEQNVAISARLDGAMASEAAQCFLSRLRVGFIDLGGLGGGLGAGQSVQAADLVFLHDVIARGARAAWRRVPEPPGGWLPFEHGAPDGETRRRPFEKGARKTEALLVPAERPLEVQHYLDLVRDLHGDHRDAAEGHYVPVREIDFDESGVGAVLDQAHRVARWVVTYDAIADLHLFRSNGVDIIRYVPRPGGDHSLIVSTRQPGTMLLAKLSEEIGRVLSAGGTEAEALARLCIDNASAISGRVVLRAARLENNALELLGLVLNRQVVLASLAPGSVPVCWLLLDDFADRLGHKGRKADILVVCLSAPDGVPAVELVVVESKFTGQDGEGAAMADSMEQLRASTGDLRDRVIGADDALNRPTWLRRLADLLLEHGAFPGAVGGRDPGEWARLIRSDEAALGIVGLSLVFVHDRLDGAPEPMASPAPEQRQFVFNRDQVAEGLRAIQAAGAGQP